MNKLGQDLYEVETYKNRISVDIPIQIGFLILQYAKLRMLEFYYDCLNRYLNKNSFELTQTDTDSIYMGINQSDLDQCISKNIRIDIRMKFLTLVWTNFLLLGFLGDVVAIILH